MEKIVCPDCGKKEVEKVNACGSETYFCNNCKKLISRTKFNTQANNQKNEK